MRFSFFLRRQEGQKNELNLRDLTLRPDMRKMIYSILVIVFLIVALLSIADRFLPFQLQKLLYPAPSIAVTTPPKGLSDQFFTREGGSRVHGWLKPPATDSTTILLVLHGNGENLETMKMGGILSSLSRLDIGLVAIDYPGYGNSLGRSTEKSCTDAAVAAYDWLGEKYPNNPRIIMGWSLGAGVMFQAIKEKNGQGLAGLIAISPWIHLSAVAREHYPNWVVQRWLKEEYDSIEAMKFFSCPLLLIHGEDDTIIPFAHGERLSRFRKDLTTWLPLANTGHNDVFSKSETWDAIRAFLAKL